MDFLEKTERLIHKINRIHAQYSKDYFETGRVPKVNLSKTLANVPTEHILAYRLNLHEAKNDYLFLLILKALIFIIGLRRQKALMIKLGVI